MHIAAFILLLIFSVLAFAIIIYDIKTGRISSDPQNSRKIVLMFYLLFAIVLVKMNLDLLAKI